MSIIVHLFYLFIGFCINQIYSFSSYETDYHDKKICVLQQYPAILMQRSVDTYRYIKMALELRQGCTHIFGDLDLSNIVSLENGTDPDMSFLEPIEEISGFLRIRFNRINHIPLKRLKVIRGQNIEHKYALDIIHNQQNLTLDLYSLRAVMNGSIRIRDNFNLHYLENMVDWSQIVQNPNTQMISINGYNMVKPHKVRTDGSGQCHESCNYWKNSTDGLQQFCFGPSAEQCQIRTKCVEVKHFQWCQFINGTVQEPCDIQCAGGCHGPGPTNCSVCKGTFKKDRCTSFCSPERGTEFGMIDASSVRDKLIYTIGGLCISRCPDALMDTDKHCVYECNFEKYYKYKNKCLECPDSDCSTPRKDTVICDLSKLDKHFPRDGRKFVLKKSVLQMLTNCTMILGPFSLSQESFKYHNVTVPLLYKHLKNVREIIGDFDIHATVPDLRNLTFLQKLEEFRIADRPGVVHPYFKVYSRSIKFLGLKNVQNIYGSVDLELTGASCYDNTIPWANLTAIPKYNYVCNATCHPLCTQGCWGPGNSMCFNCTYLTAGDYCVEKCSDVPGYFSSTQKLSVASKEHCLKCHHLCKENCTGPSEFDCKNGCLYALENGKCVEKCSRNYYPTKYPDSNDTTCIPCNNLCYDGEKLDAKGLKHACSGSSDVLGNGGCYMCERTIKMRGSNVTRCYKGSCPTGYFSSILYSSTSITQTSCEICSPLCQSCTGKGVDRAVCAKCIGYWYNNLCVKSCPNDVKNVSRILKLGENCPICHSECRSGCELENDQDTCFMCTNKKLYLDEIKSKFSCISQCPESKNYTEFRSDEVVCLSLQETASYQNRLKIQLIIIICPSLFLFFILLLILYFKWKFNQSKIKSDLKAIYSNYKETNIKGMKEEALMKPPNMNRLQMIPISDLTFDIEAKPLGAGAFGKVYRGLWRVPGPNGKCYKLDVVIKMIHNSSKSSTDEFLEEAKIMASVTHRHCLPLIGVCLSLSKPCLVSSFAEFGSLDKYLHQYCSKISSYSMLKWAEQIADGMAYLSLRGIIHRDLAARNVLVCNKDMIQITDFGLARLVDDVDDVIVIKSGRVPYRWLALETLLNATYSTTTDVWAYGVTLWEIFTFGRRPYEEMETTEIKTFLLQGSRLYQPEICTLEVYMIMVKCWLEDPQMRPSFREMIINFEQFSLNPKRYLCIARENRNINRLSTEQSKEMIPMHQFSVDHLLANNRSDDGSWNQSIHNDNSSYYLLNNVRNKSDYDSSLPMRKKPKRSITFNKIKNKLLSKSYSRNSATFYYHQSSVEEPNRTAYSTYNSVSGLINNQKSLDSDTLPINRQVFKLRQEGNKSPKTPSSASRILLERQSPERIFLDKEASKDPDSLSEKSATTVFTNRSPSLPPARVHSTGYSDKPSDRQRTITNETINMPSPDSGNSHNFDADDYLIPSRISSIGYYNITPSPSSNVRSSINFIEPKSALQNETFIPETDADGYLEPIIKSK